MIEAMMQHVKQKVETDIASLSLGAAGGCQGVLSYGDIRPWQPPSAKTVRERDGIWRQGVGWLLAVGNNQAVKFSIE